ncbi:Zinc finger C2H2 superfamily [Sergentomyia squamirostris]
MEKGENNKIIQCKFIQNLWTRISQVHNEFMEHENLIPNCRKCLENSSEFALLRKQLFVIIEIILRIKAEDHDNEVENSQCRQVRSHIPDLETVLVKEESLNVQDTLQSPAECDYLDDTSTDSNSQSNEKEEETSVNTSFYECELCQMKMSRKCHLLLHMRSHTRKEKIRRRKIRGSTGNEENEVNRKKCILCNSTYKKRHDCGFGEPRTSSRFTCEYCPNTFNTYPKIYAHHKREHPDKPRPLSPFQCHVCGTFALRLSALTRHMKIHAGYTPYECNVCQKKFLTRTQLVEHQRKHIPKSERDDKYKCEVCNRKFAFRQSMVKHKKQQHRDDRVIFHCNVCGGKFISETSLQKHQLIHDGKAPRAHKCDQCGRIFEKKKYFNQHRKIQHNIYTPLMLNPKHNKKE